MKFNHFLQPATVAEALTLVREPDTVILGGTMWLHLQKRTVNNAVDLSKLGLDKIEETPDGISIGAYVTLRDLETSPLLLRYTFGGIKEALAPIVGVQFRNTATLGGSIFGRFGFSDVCTLFTALGATVCLAEKGVVPMADFVRDGAPRDLLTHIILPKQAPDGFVALAHRNAATDFPVVTTAVCKRGNIVRVTMSPAPTRGKTFDFDTQTQDAAAILDTIASTATFGSDRAASSEYRAHLVQVLVKRALAAIGG